MTAAFFLIAIMGCGEGDVPCQAIRLLDARYESRAACAAAALARNLDADFPVVVAQCHAGGPLPRINSKEVRLPEPESTPLFHLAKSSR